MKVLATIVSSKQFDYNGSKFVTVEGFIGGLGIFRQTIRESLIPDNLEGKNCEIEFNIGLTNFKPTLKVVNVKLLDGGKE